LLKPFRKYYVLDHGGKFISTLREMLKLVNHFQRSSNEVRLQACCFMALCLVYHHYYYLNQCFSNFVISSPLFTVDTSFSTPRLIK